MTDMTEYAAPPPPPPPYMVQTLPRDVYASWGQRVGAYLLDMLFSLVGIVPMIAGFVVLFSHTRSEMTTDAYGNPYVQEVPTGSTVGPGVALIVIGVLLLIGIWIWNRVLRQGRTGYSWGKSIVGIKLIKESTGQPTRGWWCLLREVVHSVNGAIFALGWLWPLWDSKRQTWSDMITRTVVIRQPKA